MNGLPDNAVEIAAAVRSGRLSAKVVVERSLARIEAADGRINAFTAIHAERALASAAAVDAQLAGGRDPGPLAGVPFAVKNLFDVAGEITLAGSLVQADAPPAPEDAEAVARLKAQGAILLGALNMDEYAYGFVTENAHYGVTRNPHDPSRLAGGSSGGSAAAVAAAMVPLALGSDTNGSIRVPASFCGVYGLKPTFGRVSRRGVFPFVHSLDHAGPFARTAADLAAAYDAIQGPDPRDPAASPRPVEPTGGLLHAPLEGIRTARLGGWFDALIETSVHEAVMRVADHLGAAEVEFPDVAAARAAAFCLTAAEGGALHLPNLRRRPQDFDPATRDRLIAGAILPARIAIEAQRFRRHFLEAALTLFERFDLLVAPCTPFVAPPVGEPTVTLGGRDIPVRANAGLYTQPFSFIGLPALSAPVAVTGPPIGVQLIAPPWREDLLLRTAARLEAGGLFGANPLPETLT